MARPQNSPILAQLRSAKTLSEQTTALRVLKNEIVGHVQKKELWIGLGVLEPIVRTLSFPRPASKSNGKDALPHNRVHKLSDEDDVKLQALQLVASFANGGPSFLSPLHAVGVLPAVLNNISPSENHPQIVVAALRALQDIANASVLASSTSPLSIPALADHLFSSNHIESLNLILSNPSSTTVLQSQASLAANLICQLCREERHQHGLTSAGVLDSLAARLASFVVAGGFVVPEAKNLAFEDGLAEVFPPTACPNSKIGPALAAIVAVVGDSKYRAYRLANSPAILAIFPNNELEQTKSSRGPRGRGRSPLERILPTMPTTPLLRSRSTSQTPFPTPDGSDSRTSSRTSLHKFASASLLELPHLKHVSSSGVTSPTEDVESPLLPWLIYLVRKRRGYDRLMAAAVLASLLKAGLGRNGSREASIGMLVIPIVVNLIAERDKDGLTLQEATEDTQCLILEKAPIVLARLITDDENLQRAAFDCDAAKVLTKLLKRAYEPVPELDQQKYWSPQIDNGMDLEGTSPVSQLGDSGQNPLLAHRVRLRESALKAIGALASGKEDYRKALVAQDFVPYVVESLCEFPSKPAQQKDKSKERASNEASVRDTCAREYGTNPLSVIIAGCHVVRVLSRSVSVLRTVLVDYGVALPVFQFMKHSDINVQIAATATIINLVVQVSPVRELLAENGVLKVLCEHAHSDNPSLRLNALWALKHFVDAVGPDLKKACLEQLEPGWLVQLIYEKSQDNDLYGSRAKEPANDDDLDEDMDMQPQEEVVRWLYGANGSLNELDASKSSRLRQAEDRLAAVRDSEVDPARRARNEDIAIQEQGLDFIRNFIGRTESKTVAEFPAETTEMIDYIFSELGQERLFEILASKLKSKVLHPFHRRAQAATGRDTRILHPQPKIVAIVIYILVHIAASTPRHRQLVIAQTELLQLLVVQSSSKDREVRVALCHLVINLTWQEDSGDGQACIQRATELKRLGFHTKMESLKHQDRDLDVRERAKTAAGQIEQVTY